MVPTSRKLAIAVVVAGVLLATAAVALAAGGATKLTANMNARQVVPTEPRGNVAHATGKFVGAVSRNGSRWSLSWRITYSKLDHPSIVIADIHRGSSGKFGPVLVRLCGPCTSGAHGVKRVQASDIPLIRSGRAFVTLITGRNPNGEIRGQIRVAPRTR
jgi:CHRD domain